MYYNYLLFRAVLHAVLQNEEFSCSIISACLSRWLPHDERSGPAKGRPDELWAEVELEQMYA